MTSRLAALPLLASLALLAVPARADAKTDFTRKYRQPCEYCHKDGWMSGTLTEAGLYFGKKRTLKGFVAKPQPSHPAKRADKKPT